MNLNAKFAGENIHLIHPNTRTRNMSKINKPKQLKILLLFFLIAVNISMLLIYFFFQTQRTSLSPKQAQYPELAQINGSKGSFQEITDYFTKLANTKGAAYAYEVLKRTELAAGTDYHLLAHAVGDVLYKQQGIEGIKVCTNDFRNACSHSVVIGIFRKDGLRALDAIAKACKEAPGGKGAYTMCFHGLGHGVLAYTEYNMEDAVKLCQKTGTKEYYQQEYIECVGGVTMEMANGVHDIPQWEKMYPMYFSKDNPLSPCNRAFMPAMVRPQCYVYLTPKLFEAAGTIGNSPSPDEIDTAFSYCDQIPFTDQKSRNECYGGFGKEFIVLAQGGDIRQMETLTKPQLQRVTDWCELADRFDAIQSCLDQAANSLYWGGENSWDTSVGLCSTVGNEQKKNCYTNIMNAVSYYSDDPSDKKTFCQALPKTYQDDCKKKVLAYAK
jgi:hypothetical protein